MTLDTPAPRPPAEPPAAGVGRRQFLTLATAGVAASTLTVTVGSLSPAAAATAPGSAAGDAASGLRKRELRAMWISSVVNIDWPSASGLSAEQQQAEFVHWLDVARDFRLNAVFVQVRPTADAFWPSPYEPWSQYLTGTQGQDPGYDPLAFVVEKAHERNLEIHAWYNPYRVSMQADPAQLVPEHPARQHPDWVWAYGGKLYFDPGIPEAREHIYRAILHSVENYDLDGVHFDDYFYPYAVAGQTIPDAHTYATYGAGFATVEDWRRHNVDEFVRTISERIKQTKPWVKFGISPFGIWRNASTDPLGSDTGGSQSYDMQFADTRKWVLEGWLDYINPQIYWQFGLAVADYAKLVPWWADVAAQSGTQLYVGEALYKVTSGVFTDPAELSKHVTYCHEQENPVHGNVYFSAKHVPADPQGSMSIVRDDHYRHPAIVPAMPHLPGTRVRVPVLATARRTGQGVSLHWNDSGPRRSAATSFAIYRVEGRVRTIDVEDPTALLATVRSDGHVVQHWTDEAADPGTSYTYVVTALDRVWNESAPSHARSV
ncbi:glycoside hydrolase family 10 protein [Cellulosimicrobium marinum]|uniref:glycoside hydrolase family 10 protein n=1 Tax=Cellulosimicrobium marinum TaxID=1638992 RepID=UPI001E522990|nr:family 10 glycosylhydrolase [Cellulosimicrobium marinum]MCB7135672.1 family 10 glycosylhydrolase [Cellulosimicrobium marinum]